jgi:hypothetical protein
MKRTYNDTLCYESCTDHNKENISPIVENVTRQTKRMCIIGTRESSPLASLLNVSPVHNHVNLLSSFCTPKPTCNSPVRINVPPSLVQDLDANAVMDQDQHNYLRNKELVQHRTRQNANLPHMYVKKHRATCTEWLSEVAEAENISSQTVHVASLLMDRYLAQEPNFPKLKYQLLAATCFLVSAKMEEVELIVPSLNDLHLLCDEQFKKQDFVLMEVHLLNTLQWDVVEVTPLHFMDHYIWLSTSAEEAQVISTGKIRDCASQLIDLQLQDRTVLQAYTPSLVATAAIATARMILGLPRWSTHLATATGYDLNVVQVCCQIFYEYYCALIDEGQQ